MHIKNILFWVGIENENFIAVGKTVPNLFLMFFKAFI